MNKYIKKTYGIQQATELGRFADILRSSIQFVALLTLVFVAVGCATSSRMGLRTESRMGIEADLVLTGGAVVVSSPVAGKDGVTSSGTARRSEALAIAVEEVFAHGQLYTAFGRARAAANVRAIVDDEGQKQRRSHLPGVLTT